MEEEEDRNCVLDREDMTRKYVEENPYSYQEILDPSVPPFAPQTYGQLAGNDVVTALSQFLLKKDLQMSRITQLDDKIETFPSWKSSLKVSVKI